jgi:D-3-phosphoglycerate dehydrogenase
VRIDDYHVDVEPRGSLLVIRNRDVPGVIGKVGTLLGEAGLNIAGYHQARLSEGGQALAAVAVDGRVERNVMAKLQGMPDITDARLVELE